MSYYGDWDEHLVYATNRDGDWTTEAADLTRLPDTTTVFSLTRMATRISRTTTRTMAN